MPGRWELLTELREQAFQSASQRLTIVLGKQFDRSGEYGCRCDFGQSEEPASDGRIHQDRAPVAWVRFARGEPSVLQAVDQPCRCGTRDPQHGRQVAGAERTEDHEELKRLEITLAGTRLERARQEPGSTRCQHDLKEKLRRRGMRSVDPLSQRLHARFLSSAIYRAVAGRANVSA